MDLARWAESNSAAQPAQERPVCWPGQQEPGPGCTVPRWLGLPWPKATGPAHGARPEWRGSAQARGAHALHKTRHGRRGANDGQPASLGSWRASRVVGVAARQDLVAHLTTNSHGSGRGGSPVGWLWRAAAPAKEGRHRWPGELCLCVGLSRDLLARKVDGRRELATTVLRKLNRGAAAVLTGGRDAVALGGQLFMASPIYMRAQRGKMGQFVGSHMVTQVGLLLRTHACGWLQQQSRRQ
jgi:hypothetical protein